MLKKEHYEPFLPPQLSEQIENICNSFRAIQSEASGILRHNEMPDSTAQLNDVLQSTEEATLQVITSATAIKEALNSSDLEKIRNDVAEHVTRIYEACSFQDIAGQRIKKVLHNIHMLEGHLLKLSELARNHGGASLPAPLKSDDESSLMEGPQLAASAPTQADIDSMFLSSDVPTGTR